MNNERAPAVLAVIRIISVLGMSFAIAFGIFLLLGGWWITGLLSLLAATPFFVAMRYMEKRALAESAVSNQPSAVSPETDSELTADS
jgi:hypothetical protein